MGIVFIVPIILNRLFIILNNDSKVGLSILLAMLVCFSIVNKVVFNIAFDDKKIWHLTQNVNHPKLKYIKTTKERKVNIEEILSLYSKIKAEHTSTSILFFGTDSHIFNYLTDTHPRYPYTWAMDLTNSKTVNKLKRIILDDSQDYDYIFLILDYPERTQNPGEVLGEMMLGKLGYHLYTKGNQYSVYAK